LTPTECFTALRHGADGLSKPQTLSAKLFGLRAETLVNGLPAATARARLSGLLIGLELGGARPYWLGQRIALVGDPDLCGLYHAALTEQGAQPDRMPGDAMTLAGLKDAYVGWKDTTK
jgi:2-dehydro-3-deoxygalactonokinase